MSTKIWHNSFENKWLRAFPLGNGRIGAMVYGNPQCEQIQLNEESLWSGKQIKEEYGASPEKLEEIRKLIFAGKLNEARNLSAEVFLSKPARVRPFETFGDIYIDFHDKNEYTNYRKELELSEGLTQVSYEKEDIKYESETFISEKYDALVYRVKTGGKPFSCDVTITRAQDSFTSVLNQKDILMQGRLVCKEDPKYGEGFEGMAFGSRVHIVSDGVHTSDKHSITVSEATEVTVYCALATNYNVQTYDVDETVDFKAKLSETIEALKKADYEEIKKEHINEHKKWFERVAFKLDAPDYSHLPTDERIQRVKDGAEDDLDLYTLYYNFGRYLLIECSGKNATLPANLQGVWNDSFTPPWEADYHTNINLQMNYWPVENANMSEAFTPFVHFMKMMSKFGKHTAKNLFFTEGWAINHTTDAFGRTGVHNSGDCGFFPMAGPWLCLNLWEHYEFTNDMGYLQEIYPVLKGSCEFVKGFLTEDKNGNLVTCPSNSPENSFFYVDVNGEKKASMFTYGPTMDNQIIYSLLTRTITACEILNCDGDFAESLKEILRRIPPLRVSERYGTICEWAEDYEETEPGHRHISHLYGLFPADQINETDSVIFEAAKRTIARRLEHSGGATGWSRAWIINFYARLKDGNNCAMHLKELIRLLTEDNMFDLHPPHIFQIDGNLGCVSGITEMLIQSHLGATGKRVTELLPALPDAWKDGSVKGIKARGNFEFDLEWKNGRITKLKVKACCDNTLYLKTVEGMDIKKYTVNDGIIEIPMVRDETVVLVG